MTEFPYSSIYKVFYICVSVSFFTTTNAQLLYDEEENYPVFDMNLYKNELNSDLCQAQIKYMTLNNTLLLLRFLDASMRTPRGITRLNWQDLGNYYQCLDIDEPYERSTIAGKYCKIHVPYNQQLNLPEFYPDLLEAMSYSNVMKLVPEGMISDYHIFIERLRGNVYRSGPDDLKYEIHNGLLKLAVCIPKACSVKEALDTFFFNISSIDRIYEEQYCRLPGDKPWVIADTIALVTFIVISFLTLMSTAYELFLIFVLKRAENRRNVVYRSFSLYKNTQLLCTFSRNEDFIRCLEGIKILSLLIVITSHVLLYSSYIYVQNPELISWLPGRVIVRALIVLPFSVDTFFAITGILLVYNTARNMTGTILLKNLHVFYLKRLVRLIPLLATVIIFETSIFHKIADGPEWYWVAENTQLCRKYWWSTLLLLQNYINPEEMCVKQSWYVSLDLHMHFLSPLLLYWILNGKNETARAAIIVALICTMVISAIYCFRMDLPSDMLESRRNHEVTKYFKFYYVHIISRISGFLVGIIVGYILHIWRGKIVKINKFLVACLWFMAFGTMSLVIYVMNRAKQKDWNNHTIDSLINILARPAWTTAIGWIVIACTHGYGGPVNWFLSLHIWRLPNRLSYGAFLFHYPIIVVAHGCFLMPELLSIVYMLYICLGHIILSFMFSFVFTLLIDMPMTILSKRLLDRDTIKSSKQKRLQQIGAYELELSKE